MSRGELTIYYLDICCDERNRQSCSVKSCTNSGTLRSKMNRVVWNVLAQNWRGPNFLWKNNTCHRLFLLWDQNEPVCAGYTYSTLSLPTQSVFSLEFFWAPLVSVVLLLTCFLTWFSHEVKSLIPTGTEEYRINAIRMFYNFPTFFVYNTDFGNKSVCWFAP